MRVNKFYVLKVWLMTMLFIAAACAYWPNIRTYPDKVGFESIEYRAGMFCGVFLYEFKFSVSIFICLYLLYYLLTARFYLSEILVKTVLFIFFLIGAFIANRIYFPESWFHPFFIAYSVGAVLAFCVFEVYRFDPRYY